MRGLEEARECVIGEGSHMLRAAALLSSAASNVRTTDEAAPVCCVA